MRLLYEGSLFRRNQSRDDRYWLKNDLKNERDDRIAIQIKYDNDSSAMMAKKSVKKCAHFQSLCFAYLTCFIIIIINIIIIIAPAGISPRRRNPEDAL